MHIRSTLATGDPERPRSTRRSSRSCGARDTAHHGWTSTAQVRAHRIRCPMSGRLSNKVALITGAGSGLGREMGLLFGKEGARVVINDIDADAGERTAAEIGNEASFTPGDVSNPDDVEDLFNAIGKTHGRLDVSVHNAGIMDPRDEGVLETPIE